MTIRFQLMADAEAQCLPRVLDHFALRDLIPSAVVTYHVGSILEIMIEHPTIEDGAAALICERMGRAVGIVSATVRRLR